MILLFRAVGGVRWKMLAFLPLVIWLSACKSSFPDPVAYIGFDDGWESVPIANNCDIIPYFSKPFKFRNFSLDEAVDSSFAIWTKGFPRLVFQSMELESKAVVKVEVANPINFSFPTLNDGDSSLSDNLVQSITFLKRVDGNYVILVNSDYPWTRALLIRAITFQIGRLLGVEKSEVENDAMYPKIYAKKNENSDLELTSNDLKKINDLYSTSCGFGRWVNRKSMLAPFFNDQNKYALPVTFSLPESDTLYLLWPNQSLNEWLFYKILVDNDNSQKDIWSKGVSLKVKISSFATSRQPAGIFAFTVGSRAFIGSGQWFTDPKEFFEYNVITGVFETRQVSLKVIREIYSIAIGGPNNKGYLLSVDQDNPALSSLAIMDPNRNAGDAWLGSVQVPEPIYTATTMFATNDNRICLFTGYAAYFLSNTNQWEKLTFNIADPDQFKEPRLTIVGANELSLKAFAVDSRTFLLRDNYGVEKNRLGAGIDSEVFPEDFWQIDLNSNFKFLNRSSLPAQGLVLAAFGHKGRAYVLTSKGRLYSIVP
ncbi:hypothetical protein [Dyadobacter frigoris]|uniref:Uncharacterized protein n=1 Tax=Dyadobacter frigoris TaxID=2576211 RepID=A0A4U6CNV6_9BACT|nr:hypothetical protein [Dyadobacter frigoris]TKT85265.1 hypothetical protein FDK13_34295 [Dyadobacter frigoris]